MTPEQKKEFLKEEAEEHHHHEERGPLYIERPHECDLDPNSKSPLASCRNKYPPKPNHEKYDLTRPKDSMAESKKEDDRTHPKSWLKN